VILDRKARLGPLGPQVRKAPPDHQVRAVPRATMVQKDSQDPQEILDRLVYQAWTVTLEHREIRERQAPRELLELQEQRAYRDPQEPQETQALQDYRVTVENQELQAPPASPAPTGMRDRQALSELQDRMVFLDRPVHQARQARQAMMETLERQVRQVLLVLLDKMALQVPQDIRALRERMERMECRVTLDNQAHKALLALLVAMVWMEKTVLRAPRVRQAERACLANPEKMETQDHKEPQGRARPLACCCRQQTSHEHRRWKPPSRPC
jgi:hypothetical protein